MNVINGTVYWPQSFKKSEIDQAIQEAFADRDILNQTEESITKKVIAVLLEKRSVDATDKAKDEKREKRKTRKKQEISVEDFQRFEGVI